jgi:hypothetical protein
MKLVGFAQIYNELEKDNLPRFMDSVDRYCDALVIYNDASTDGGMDWIRENYPSGAGRLKQIEIIEGEKNNFSNEIAHKQIMLDKCNEIGADWIFWLDADEVIEPRGETGDIRKLCEAGFCDAYGFREVNLWRSSSFYRLDNAYNDGEFCRLWKNNGKLFYDDRPGLHQRQYPDGIGEIVTSDIKVIHYCFSSDGRIIDKYKTYKSHGQNGWALTRLIDERTLRVGKSSDDWFSSPIDRENFEEVFKLPVASRI